MHSTIGDLSSFESFVETAPTLLIGELIDVQQGFAGAVPATLALVQLTDRTAISGRMHWEEAPRRILVVFPVSNFTFAGKRLCSGRGSYQPVAGDQVAIFPVRPFPSDGVLWVRHDTFAFFFNATRGLVVPPWFADSGLATSLRNLEELRSVFLDRRTTPAR